jgi:hypothetical protein
VVAYFAPQFAELRRRSITGGEAAFVASLSRCRKWDSSGGKSNAYFAKSRDERYIVKQLSRSEKVYPLGGTQSTLCAQTMLEAQEAALTSRPGTLAEPVLTRHQPHAGAACALELGAWNLVRMTNMTQLQTSVACPLCVTRFAPCTPGEPAGHGAGVLQVPAGAAGGHLPRQDPGRLPGARQNMLVTMDMRVAPSSSQQPPCCC